MSAPQTALLFAAALALIGCSDQPGGSVEFTITGDAQLPADLQGQAGITWDGENPWTRELTCELDASLQSSSWSLRAVDRSVGDGLSVALLVEAYDGPGTYTRDRFQPDSALAVEYQDPDSQLRTSLDLAGGGTCSITVDDGSKSGTFSCDSVALSTGDATEPQPMGVEGTFLCNTLDHPTGGRAGMTGGTYDRATPGRGLR